ncbi:hypothetical protein SAMN02745126_02783 [Enhydrobacter aerosaccus]|uniref:Tat (Twin-arginine translocation) pathway signal sequence n=1 Tax=Enhydrobacter aerosaccus TaxID=225324 RepID=A0A1T4PGX7_9HYPH|nr:hypothetical protein [Enhydrobacter aerosaccus]SJZ90038.1 hypothetical protein SAMN02745126_02783 [Enhydrobacter aerosaccus]
MVNPSRRTTLKYLGFAAVAAPLTGLSVPALADEDLYIASRYQNFDRGTVHSLDPSTRGLVVDFPNKGSVKMKAADLVVRTSSGYAGNSYAELKVGQTIDVQWYDYVDFLVAKTTPEVTAHAKAMVAQGARIEGLPGSEHQIRLFSLAGMVVSTDPQYSTFSIINASGGEPDKPAPDSGEVIRLPQIQTDAGKAALATLKPGDNATTVYSVQTAIKIVIIR